MRDRSIARAASAALCAVLLSATPFGPARAAGTLTRNDFVEAYVRCNNAAWAGNARATIEPREHATSADLMGGVDSPLARGFMGEQLYVAGVWAPLEPRRTATVGWALATKAYADRGGVLPRYRARAAALAVVRGSGLRAASTLDDAELGAIATDVHIARANTHYALTEIPAASASAPLDAASARAMLAKIGTHLDIGRQGPRAGARCPSRVLRSLFRARS